MPVAWHSIAFRHGDHAMVRSTLKPVSHFDVGDSSLASAFRFAPLVQCAHIEKCDAEAMVGGEDGGDAR